MPAAGVGPLTYSIGATLTQQDLCPQHHQPQHSMIDLLHTPVGATAVDVTVAQPGSVVASDHAARSTPPPLFQRLPLLR